MPDASCNPSAARQTARRVVVEAAVVAIIGAILAFAANALSPRGLALSRNYFPTSTPGVVAAPPDVAEIRAATSTNQNPTSTTNAPLANPQGLQLVDSNRVAQLFEQSRSKTNGVVFIDARNEDDFHGGHIPGAYEFDPYHPEKRIASVLPLCQGASQIVMYCTGGDCEDSRFAAVMLRDAGTPNDKLFVYVGGITEWRANDLPVETGEPARQ